MEVRCMDGSWYNSLYQKLEEVSVTCDPICNIPCQNKGICVFPNTCLCPTAYEGPQCQYMKKSLCWENPSPIENSIMIYK